jgi:RHH-type proline utilization regulon transcriptional repressor/proline dehydrogenase/delta 1-pyrroline-5-carboxylate dehydrogenase
MLKGAMAELRGAMTPLANDIGPVITDEARQGIKPMSPGWPARGCTVHRLPLPARTAQGHFVAPTIIELSALSDLGDEVFGPVLHVVRYARTDRARLVDAVNAPAMA